MTLFSVFFFGTELQQCIFRKSCYNFELIRNFSPHQWRQLLEFALTSANFIDHLDLRFFHFGSHSRNKDVFIVSFDLRWKFIFLFFKKAIQTLSLCEFSWTFGLQAWCTSSILFNEANFSPINESSCWNLPFVQIRMISLLVFIHGRGQSSYFSSKQIEFWAYVNSPDHLDWSHNAPAVFI